MAEDAASVDLRILSPSFENGIHLADLPATTTIGALRLRIHDAAPSRPAPDHMRLIYRGRVVANDSDTLQTIFGIENIRESKSQTLHLVLREQPGAISTPSPAPPPASVPPHPVQNPLQTNPFRNLPEHRPSSAPHAPQPQHPQIHQQPPFLHPPGFQARVEALRSGDVPAANQRPAQATPQVQAGAPNEPQGPQGQQTGQPMGLPNLPAGTTRTVRREGFGPNGERWTVTWNNSTVVHPSFIAPNPNPNHFVAHRPYPNPLPGLGLPVQRTPSPSRRVSADEIVQRVSMNLGRARVEVQNMTTLSRPPSVQSAPVAFSQLPPYRIPYLRSCMRSLLRVLDNVDQDLLLLQTSSLSVRTPEFVDLTQAGIDLRRQAMDFANLLNQLPQSDPNVPSSPAIPTPPPAAVPANPMTPQQSTEQPPSDVPTELFILSSPQGPVGILFDQQGTYSTAPVMPTMPFQTFTQNFMANRQHVAAIGQQLAANIQAFPQTRFAAMPGQQAPAPTSTQPAVPQQPNQNGNQAQAQAQAQPLAAAPIANADQPQVLEAAPENNRVDNIAGHLWLIFKLACFVYFFAGGPGWYRPIMICLIAGIVYLAQVGIFEDHLTAARQYLENLLPPGAFGDAAAPANRRNNNAAAVAAAAGLPPQGQRRAANRNLTPEQVAQRLQQQHRDQRFGWIRDTMRTTERAVALFVASLWPGIGERMVQAQEERVRAERAAEEERERAAEEERRREEEEKQRAEVEGETEKGKEREVDEHSGLLGHAEVQTADAASSFEGKGKEKARVEDVSDEVD